jgi:hypothetical protein
MTKVVLTYDWSRTHIQCRTGREMHVATGSPQNFKVDVCEAHALNVVLMFQNKAADQEKVKDAIANDINLLSSAWR